MKRIRNWLFFISCPIFILAFMLEWLRLMAVLGIKCAEALYKRDN